VKATLQRLGGSLVREQMPKTKSSRRALPLPQLVVEALQTHRASQVQERLAAPVWADDALVFTTSVGTPLEPRNVLRSFHALCDRAAVRRVRFHDLRHAAASFMLLQGVDMRVVMGTLGHSRLATTSDLYTHLLEPVQRAAADRMDDLLRQVTPGPGT
jgi:integrase